jgi:hypothetical protein
MGMAEREGMPRGNLSNDLHGLTAHTGATEGKRLFGGVSNRGDPAPEMRTAAPAGTRNGGKQVGKWHSQAEDYHDGDGSVHVVRRSTGLWWTVLFRDGELAVLGRDVEFAEGLRVGLKASARFGARLEVVP